MGLSFLFERKRTSTAASSHPTPRTATASSSSSQRQQAQARISTLSTTTPSVSLSHGGGGGGSNSRISNEMNGSIHRISRSLWLIRFAFLFSLATVAFGLAFLSFFLVKRSEQKIGKQQFETLAARALNHVEELRLRRRENMKSMAQIAATAFPDASRWPVGVAIPAFERIADDLIRTSDHVEMAFYPLVEPEEVQPGEQEAWEKFAFEYLHQEQGLNGFGRGIWKRPGGPDSTPWKSNYTAMFPELQNSRKGRSGTAYLMVDIHAEPTTGRAIDEALTCSTERQQRQDRSIDCGAVTNITHWNRASFLVQPIYPIHDPFELVGVIVSMFSWDRIMDIVFTEVADANGVHVVLQSQGKFYTYLADKGTSTFIGQRDLHDPGMSKHAQRTTLSSWLSSDNTQRRPSSHRYYDQELTVYPTASFFEVYTTHNALIALLSSIVAVLFTTLIFLVYDLYVRREFVAKQKLLQAKRKFMRFVSHEVRTPLNAVCMGLSLLQEEMASALVRFEPEPTEESVDAAGDMDTEQGTFQSSEMCDEQMSLLQEDTTLAPPRVTFEDAVSTNATGAADDAATGLILPSPSSSLAVGPKQPRNNTLVVGEEGREDSRVIDHRQKAPHLGKQELHEWHALLGEIYSSAQNSVDVLNDVLHYDRISTGTLTLELAAYNIWQQIIEASSEFRLSAKQKKIRFHLDLSALMTAENDDPSVGFDPESLADIKIPREAKGLVVIADPLRIAQVLRNLVSNALKFTPELGKVTVRASWEASNDKDGSLRGETFTLHNGEDIVVERMGSVKIEVVDSGVGMSQEQLTKLFRAGVQFNVNELQAGQGSGLGLAIAKGIVKQHNGRLEVSSPGLGHGTTFTCTLNLYRNLSDKDAMNSSRSLMVDFDPSCSTTEANCTNDNKEDACHLRVLVVDDVLSNRRLLSKLVTNRGHVTEEAKDGQEAVDKVVAALEEGVRYDCILIDQEMPRKTGPEAVREIRDLGCDTFVVGVTGNVLADDVRYFMSCGANAVLPKPVNMKQLEMLWSENGIVDGLVFSKS